MYFSGSFFEFDSMFHLDGSSMSKNEMSMRRPACLWSVRAGLVIAAACVIFTF
ncbi:MAG: hypothetical protein ACI8PV_001959 [Dinoroseobacter sp.]|jgi:hypothetical protein